MLQKIAFFTFLVLGFGLSNTPAQTPPSAPEQKKSIEKPKGVFIVDPSGESNSRQSSGAGMVARGVVNGAALSLPKPAYPAAARAVKAEGAVNVQVLIDEQGNVASAQAVSGHPLLRQAAEQAALGAKFKPTMLSGQPVKVNGIIVYNFVGPGPNWLNTGFSLGMAESQGIKSRIDLPDGFSDEEKQFEMIGKLSPPEQAAQIANNIAIIKSRLTPVDLWRFEFGLAKGKIISDFENDNALFTNLAKFRELANNKPEGIQIYELNRAAELAKFADKTSLTKEDKEAIFSYLR